MFSTTIRYSPVNSGNETEYTRSYHLSDRLYTTTQTINTMKEQKDCHHCEGKGYIEIRDCTGEIQREETCVFCGGSGQIIEEEKVN